MSRLQNSIFCIYHFVHHISNMYPCIQARSWYINHHCSGLYIFSPRDQYSYLCLLEFDFSRICRLGWSFICPGLLHGAETEPCSHWFSNFLCYGEVLWFGEIPFIYVSFCAHAFKISKKSAENSFQGVFYWSHFSFWSFIDVFNAFWIWCKVRAL